VFSMLEVFGFTNNQFVNALIGRDAKEQVNLKTYGKPFCLARN